MKEKDSDTRSQALTFFVSGDEYAIGILKVKEIIEYETPTRVPVAPACVVGVINLRGTVVPVVDLALKFGFASNGVTPRSCFVIVEATVDGEELVMGVLADSVSQVVDLAPEDIEPPPSFGTRVRADFLMGMVRSDRKFILLLDIDRTLATIDVDTTSLAAGEAVTENPTAEEAVAAQVPA
jgi:purine-binding chemotaxis protein CheW